MKGYIRSGDEHYPEKLAEIKSPPKGLYYRGDISVLGDVCAAVVGSRKCTEYGRAVARSLGRRLAACGITVVSGMATGIDRAAHQGALEAGGRTIAVFGSGTDICYPPSNRDIMAKILENGLVISEYPEGTEPFWKHFPHRNRIISGISSAVVVVEAAYRSGSLITAEYAMDQDRPLYTVPANINSKAAFGSNDLLRKGAIPLVSYDDLVIDLGKVPARDEDHEEQLEGDELAVYRVVKEKGEVSGGEISNITMMDPSVVKGIISVLEMKGMVVTSMGRVLVNNIIVDS